MHANGLSWVKGSILSNKFIAWLNNIVPIIEFINSSFPTLKNAIMNSGIFKTNIT